QDYTSCATTAAMTAAGLPLITSAAPTTGGKGYDVEATSKSGNKFKISKDPTTGVVTRSCTATVTGGGCPTGLTW
ncbi:MAG: hypothetical protein JWQ18_330, partial [Conexibacter sp.]|nr:hypothetical protein [Conexibacter sp.]